MKILNIFKKESSRASDSKKANFQTLDKNQLEKVIGGTETTTPTTTEPPKTKIVTISTSHIE